MKSIPIQDIKYKVLLVAYKDLNEREEGELQYYFISNITGEDRIRDKQNGIEKSCVGMTYRVGLYHSWYSDTILEKLREGYKLGIIEIPKSYKEVWESRLKELEEKYNIIIVETQEL